MTLRWLARAMVVLLGTAGLALVAWSYGALGPVWLLQALPGCA
jgi:hypothetical protein